MNTGRIITTALAATILAIPAMADAPGYFKVPGTDTTMKIYGFADTWAEYTTDGNINDDLSAVHDAWDKSGRSWSYVYGRVGVTSTTPSPLGDVNTKVEFELRSTGSSNSWNGGTGAGTGIRLRHAYGEFAGLLIGQTNSLFIDWQYCPNYNDDWLEDNWGNRYRTRQIRYTFNPTKGLKIGFSMEQDLSGGSYTSIGNDLNAAINYSGDWGFVTGTIGYQHAQTKAMLNGGTPFVSWDSHSGSGTSFSLGGAWNITSKDTLGMRIVKGGGQDGGYGGIYGGLADGFFQNLVTGEITFEKTLSIDLGYTHTWNDQWETNLGIGQISWKKNHDLILSTNLNSIATYKTWDFFINTNWHPTKNTTFGIEYMDNTIKVSDSDAFTNDLIVKDNGELTNKAHTGLVSLWFRYNFF
jgi:hypothetical protein